MRTNVVVMKDEIVVFHAFAWESAGACRSGRELSE
jgi:hypothetical protein